MSTKSNATVSAACVVLSLLLSVPATAQFGGPDDGIGGEAEEFRGDFGGAPYGADDSGFEDGDDIGPMAVPRSRPDGTVQLHLKDGSVVVGKLVSDKPLKLKSAFGDVAIPTMKIASLQFGEDVKSTRITLRNGDRVTGELHLEKIELKAVWGEVAIETKHLLGIVSKDLAQGYQRVRRAVVERGDRGERVVRYIEELVPADRRAYPLEGGDPSGTGYGDPGVPAYGDGGDFAPDFDAGEGFGAPAIGIDATPAYSEPDLVPLLPEDE